MCAVAHLTLTVDRGCIPPFRFLSTVSVRWVPHVGNVQREMRGNP
jgi:hypothetical protein